MVRIGDMRYRVNLKNPTKGRTAGGGETLSYASIGYAWAAREDMSGSEAEEAGRFTGIAKTKWTVWDEGYSITRETQLEHNSEMYRIREINRLGENHMMELITEKRDGDN